MELLQLYGTYSLVTSLVSLFTGKGYMPNELVVV